VANLTSWDIEKRKGTHMKGKIQSRKIENLLGSFMFIGIGLFFLVQAQKVETNQANLIGPSLVPSIISILLIVLGIITGVRALFFIKGAEVSAQSKGHGLQTYLKLSAITLLGFFYIWAFEAFGYLASTFLVSVIIMYIFGIRKITRLATYAVVGSISYYLVFVKLMKIYDPPGALINVQSLLPF